MTGRVVVYILMVTLCYNLCQPMALAQNFFAGLSREKPMTVDKDKKEIRLLANLKPSRFEPGWFTQLPGHHAVTWKGGRKGDEALFQTYVSDSEFHEAMIELGAKPGNNLTKEAWEERDNKKSKAPKMRVEGTPVDVLVYWQGLDDPINLTQALIDQSGKGVQMRFGGHKKLISYWKSGCIVCMQSCPGGKISNHNYTLADYADGIGVFGVNYSKVPKGTTNAVVIIQIK